MLRISYPKAEKIIAEALGVTPEEIRRKKIYTPLIIVGDSAHSIVDVLEAGADYLMMRPYSNGELLARIVNLTKDR